MPNDSLVRTADATLAGLAIAGLSRQPKTLPPKLFYDEAGCRLFYQITELPEYYLTRTELALLRRVGPEVAAAAEPPAVLVEYGASDETKAEILLGQTDELAPAPICCLCPDRHCSRGAVADAPADATLGATVRLSCQRLISWIRSSCPPPWMACVGSGSSRARPSAISNRSLARRFLSQARATLGRDALMLVGVDLRKDPSILIPAYDDAAGVTARFNLNLLARLNRDAGADFDLDSFAHRIIWNDAESRIEMHLESLREQTVHIGGQTVWFRRGETIHTENSYKHTIEGFAALAEAAGWRQRDVWTDAAQLFSMHLLTVA